MFEDKSEEELWKLYKKTKDTKIREHFVNQYAPLVKYVAGKIAIGMPQNVDFDDLVGYGVFGLLDAIEKFDPNKDIKFKTYAVTRIRGAIYDELRSIDWVPRSVRQKSRDLQRVFARLENQLGRIPYDDEVCDELNISMSEYENLLAEVTPTTIISLEEAMPERGSDAKELKIIDSIEDPGSDNPLKELGFTEVKNILKDTIANLPEKEKLLLLF